MKDAEETNKELKEIIKTAMVQEREKMDYDLLKQGELYFNKEHLDTFDEILITWHIKVAFCRLIICCCDDMFPLTDEEFYYLGKIYKESKNFWADLCDFEAEAYDRDMTSGFNDCLQVLHDFISSYIRK